MSHNIKIIINEQNVNEIFRKRQGAVINKKRYTEDGENPLYPSDLDENVLLLLKHHFKFTKQSELLKYRDQIAGEIRSRIDSERFSEAVAGKLKRVTDFDEETIRKKAYPNKEEGESFIPQPGSDNSEYSRMFMNAVVDAFATNVAETAGGKRRKNIADDDFSNWTSQTVFWGVVNGLTDVKRIPNMKLQHWCDYASCAPSTPDDTGEGEPEQRDKEGDKESEDDKGRKGPPPLPDVDGEIEVGLEDADSIEDIGIPIYKFGSREAAGPDGKRTQPLISKLMKTGLPKSVINTVVKSIVKDLKASGVPYYENKQDLTRAILKELLTEAPRNLNANLEKLKKAKKEKKQALVFGAPKKNQYTALRSDGEEKRFPISDFNGDKRKAMDAAKAWLGQENAKPEDEITDLPGVGGLPGVTGLPAEKPKEFSIRDCVGKTSENKDDPCWHGYFLPVVQSKDLAVYKAAAAEVSAAEAETILKDPIDNEEIEKRQKIEYLKFKEPPLDWFEIGNLVDSSKNWKTIWSGTKDNGFADGLSRFEKMAWFATSYHILFQDGKPKSPYRELDRKGAGGYDDYVASQVPATAAAMAADKASGQGSAQTDMFKGDDPQFVKNVKTLVSKLKKFQKDALRRNEVLKKAAIAKAKLKSGARGGGQIQLSVLNQQLDTISGPGLEGRDSKIVGGERTPGKPVMKRNKDTGKMEIAKDKNGNPMFAGASRRQKSLALKTAQDHLKPYLKKYGLSISESQELVLSKAIVEMVNRFGTEDPQIFTKIIKETLLKKGLIK